MWKLSSSAFDKQGFPCAVPWPPSLGPWGPGFILTPSLSQGTSASPRSGSLLLTSVLCCLDLSFTYHLRILFNFSWTQHCVCYCHLSELQDLESGLKACESGLPVFLFFTSCLASSSSSVSFPSCPLSLKSVKLSPLPSSCVSS